MNFYTVVPLSKGNLPAGLLFSVVRPRPVVMPIFTTSSSEAWEDDWALRGQRILQESLEQVIRWLGIFFIFLFYTHKVWPIHFDKNVKVAQNWRGCFYCDNCQGILESPVKDRSLQKELAMLIKSLPERYLWVRRPLSLCSPAPWRARATPLWSGCGK